MRVLSQERASHKAPCWQASRSPTGEEGYQEGGAVMIWGVFIFGAGFVSGVVVTGIAALAFMLWVLFSDMEYEP
jgi:hypothetical protein